MKTRSVQLNDSATFANLMKQLGYGAKRELIEQKIIEHDTTPENAVFIVVLNSAIVGAVSCQVINLFHQEGRCGRITSLVTDINYRGLGVGKLLVCEAEKYFKSAGCVKSEVTSGDHRSDAHSFYKSCGYTLDERRFLKHYR